jgi:hypothetical protein
MTSDLANRYEECRRIRHGILEHDFSLKRISEKREHLAVRLAECSLIRRLVVTRKPAPRTAARSLERWSDRSPRQRSASR